MPEVTQRETVGNCRVVLRQPERPSLCVGPSHPRSRSLRKRVHIWDCSHLRSQEPPAECAPVCIRSPRGQQKPRLGLWLRRPAWDQISCHTGDLLYPVFLSHMKGLRTPHLICRGSKYPQKEEVRNKSRPHSQVAHYKKKCETQSLFPRPKTKEEDQQLHCFSTRGHLSFLRQ